MEVISREFAINQLVLFNNAREAEITNWVRMQYLINYKKDLPTNLVKNEIENLKSNGVLLQNGEQLVISKQYIKPLKQPFLLKFKILKDKNFEPIAYVTKVIKNILRQFGVSEELIIEIELGTIEAVENAIKYGTDDPIQVILKIKKNTFQVKIKNYKKKTDLSKPEHYKKYEDGLTLMRGVMAMMKLFDKIRLQDNPIMNYVTFTGFKKIK